MVALFVCCGGCVCLCVVLRVVGVVVCFVVLRGGVLCRVELC